MADKGLYQRHVTSMATLGRNFQLGDLYNYHQDEIIKDCPVWEISTLASNTRVEDKYELRISCDQEPDHITGSKWENMRLDQHLQISVMAGIIDKFHGASNYASDRSDSSVATQTFVCRAKSREEYLDLQALENEKPLHLDMQNGKGQATHVVVSIVYGAEAYCVLIDEAEKQAKEKLATLWKSSLTRRQGLLEFKENFDSQEKLMHSDVKCRLYADLQREAVLECSFFEAYDHCLDLITHIQDPNAKNSVPIAVLLCPLEVILGSKTIEQIYYDVDVDLILRYCRICDKLEKMRSKAGALGSAMVEENRLRDFGEAIAKYQDILKTNIKDSVVKSRFTSVNYVKSIVEVAENHSLFKPSKLKRWLFYKEAELQMIENVTVDLQSDGIAVLADEKELKSKSSQGKKFALVLRVPNLNQDSYWILKALENFVLSNTNLVDDPDEEGDFDNDGDSTEEEEEASGIHFHTVKEREQQTRDKIRELVDFVKRNQQLISCHQVEFCVMFFKATRLNSGPHRIGFQAKYYYEIYDLKNFPKFLNLRHNLGSHLPGPPTDFHIIQHPDAGTAAKRAKIDSSFFILQWKYQDFCIPPPGLFFIVRYRLKGSSDDNWMEEKTTVRNVKTISINCEPGKALEMKVATITCVGQSEYSDVIDTDSFLHKENSATVRKKPQRSDGQSMPMVTNSSNSSLTEVETPNVPAAQLPIGLKIGFVTQSTAEVAWTPTANSVMYHLRYWPKGEDPSSRKLLVVSSNETYVRLEELEEETSYSANLSLDSTKPCETVEFQTLAYGVRFAEMLVSHCEKVETRDGMEIYAVPLTKTTTVPSEIERYTFGRPEPKEMRWNRECSQCETILLVGASGSGKTSLVNAMVNYVFGVDWTNPFRFELDQTADRINVYDFHYYEGLKTECSRFTVIDTPGYGEDANRNQEITDMMRKFFQHNNGAQELSIVGFVMKSSLQKPTTTEKFIYESLVSIFGDGIHENIKYLLTFADNNKEPPLLENFTGSGLPLPSKFRETEQDQKPSFQFNNLAFFSWNQSSPHQRLEGTYQTENDLKRTTTCNLNHFLWSMTVENFDSFFDAYGDSEPISISMIQNLLKEKMRLESTLEALESLIKVDLMRMEMISAIQHILTNQKAKIDAGVNLTITVKGIKKKKELAFGEHLATNCSKCNTTCHHSCGCLNKVAQCDVMDHSMPVATRCCQVCGCLWSLHASQPFKWEFVQHTWEFTTNSMKRHLETKFNRKLTTEELQKIIDSCVKVGEEKILVRLKTIWNCKKRLEEIISKRCAHLSPLKYINQLIADEKKERRSESRIKILKRIRLLSVIRRLNVS